MAQFLSPDPHIQAPGNWYNYNRYGYCLNNPLLFSDPTGYNWFKKFGRWIKKSADNLGDYLTKHNVKIGVGMNITPGGGPTTYKASINDRQVFNSANGAQFNGAVNVERGLNQMRMMEGITSYNVSTLGGTINSSGGNWSSTSLDAPVIGQLSFGISTSIVKGGMTVIEKEYIRQAVYNASIAHPNFIPDEIPYLSLKAPKWLRFVGKYGGYGFSVWGAANIYNQYETNQITKSEMWREQGSNAVGALPIVGTGWTAGWEAGRAICNTSGYQSFKYGLWRNYYEWRMGSSIESDPVLWSHFHRLYKP